MWTARASLSMCGGTRAHQSFSSSLDVVSLLTFAEGCTEREKREIESVIRLCSASSIKCVAGLAANMRIVCHPMCSAIAESVLLCIIVFWGQYSRPFPVFCIIRIKIVLKLIMYYVFMDPVSSHYDLLLFDLFCTVLLNEPSHGTY